MKKRKSKLHSFLNGILLIFAIVIIGEGAIIFSSKYLGFDIDSAVSAFVEEVETLTGDLKSNDISFGSAFSTRKIEGNGPMEGTGKPQSSSSLSSPENTGEEYSFDSVTYPYRTILSSDEQAVYNQIYANALLSNTNTLTLVNTLTEDELCDTMNAVFNDHPELFWLNTSYKYSYNNSNEVVQVQLSFGISGDNLTTAKNSFDNVVSDIATGAESYSTDIEKELYIHDAIAELTTYNENASLNQSAYSALVSGQTVCAGYARAFQVVCQNAGLTCYYITGTASGGDHAWNIIDISGDFYNVDLTWDDSISESYGSNVYTYFNLTDSAISVNHTRSTLSSNLPTCTATTMSYTNVYGSTVEIDDIESSDDSQITDGNFTINTPQSPVVDWHDEPSPNNAAPSSTNSSAPSNMGPQNQVPQPNRAGGNPPAPR